MGTRVLAALLGTTLVAFTASSTPAYAQVANGFDIAHFSPSERGSEWFALDSLDLRGSLRPAVGIVGEYQLRPLVVYNGDGTIRSAIVSNAVIVHPGASLVLSDRVRLAFSLPVILYENGFTGVLAGTTYRPPQRDQSIGDLRVGGDVRLFGEYGDAITGAIGVQVGLPTGDRDNYYGDGALRIVPRAQIAGDIGPITYSALLGFEYRAHTVTYATAPVGDLIPFGASIGLRLADKKLVVGPEFFGSATTDGDDLFGKQTTPVEALLGAHYTVSDLRFGGGVGTGLTRGFGTPVAHFLLSAEWAPQPDKPVAPAAPAAPSDRDHDGILDANDACPDDPGIASPRGDRNGCPDRDNDTIFDKDDACPDVPGVASEDPAKNGCPPDLDRDHDGVLDKDDACPDVPGIKSTDPKTNGCPDPDLDKDGIPNQDDACPNDPGPKDPDPKRNGCPKAFVKDGQIKILDQVKFKTSSAEILPGRDSLDVLEAVQKVLKDHPEIAKVRVEGHTDSRGNAAYNKTLSANRAVSVVKWLTTHGIEASRLTSAGFGPERPIDTNDTDAGRAQNRRVEFHIDQQDIKESK